MDTETLNLPSEAQLRERAATDEFDDLSLEYVQDGLLVFQCECFRYPTEEKNKNFTYELTCALPIDHPALVKKGKISELRIRDVVTELQFKYTGVERYCDCYARFS